MTAIVVAMIGARGAYAPRIDGACVRPRGGGTACLDALPPVPG
jgi:hypothetical protein